MAALCLDTLSEVSSLSIIQRPQDARNGGQDHIYMICIEQHRILAVILTKYYIHTLCTVLLSNDQKRMFQTQQHHLHLSSTLIHADDLWPPHRKHSLMQTPRHLESQVSHCTFVSRAVSLCCCVPSSILWVVSPVCTSNFTRSVPTTHGVNCFLLCYVTCCGLCLQRTTVGYFPIQKLHHSVIYVQIACRWIRACESLFVGI